jgi:hypothetical protein
MKEVLLVKEKEAHYHSLLARELLLFAMGTTVFLAVFLFGLFLSSDHYLVVMWILIALSTLYLWGTLLYFGVIYPRDHAYERFYKSAEKGLRERQNIVFGSLSGDDSFTKDGMSARLLKGTFEENGKVFERDFYVLGDFPSLEKGETIAIESFSSVVLSIEVLHE